MIVELYYSARCASCAAVLESAALFSPVCILRDIKADPGAAADYDWFVPHSGRLPALVLREGEAVKQTVAGASAVLSFLTRGGQNGSPG